jgi:peroxiredoxin
MKYLYLVCLLLGSLVAKASDYPTLPIGSKAPDFNLKGVDGKIYTLQSFAKAKILAIVFTCNHCPTAQAYEERLKMLVKDYAAKGVQIIAISPNDPTSVRLDELGYSEFGDTYEEMKLRAKEHAFNFPYLFDGATEIASKKYGPQATPHVFIFDAKRMLRYSGRIDDVESPNGTPKNLDTRNALDALIVGKPVPVETTKTFGCSIKWIDKKNLVTNADQSWIKEPVTLDSINAANLKTLLQNKTDKLLLVNVWATWCGPCVAELADFVAINRMYRGRDFELVTISADKPEKKDKILATLQRLHVATKNYLFNGNDTYQLIELIDPKWQGALPYTLLIEPNGKIVYAKQGSINPPAMKKLIVDHPLIGRVY